jgi:type II secretory pathway predicted ATPase ExeA
MDRRQTQPAPWAKPEPPSKDLLLPSRQQALNLLDLAVERGHGPILISGEPGSGKTWLVSQWTARENALGLLWLTVDVFPGADPSDLLSSIASALGLAVNEAESASGLRRTLVRLLSEQARDGHTWGLVIDEAHLASMEALEEVRVLSNRLGQAGGFRAIVLVGQTELAGRIATWPLRSLEARLSGRIHLGPIDADEARLLLGPAVALEEAERRHRDSAGNPGRLLRLDPPGRLPTPRRAAIRARLVSEQPQAEGDEPRPPAREQPAQSSLLPSRPPLSVEDGVIEVGWDADSDTDTDENPDPSEPNPLAPSMARSRPSAPLGVDVPVADPYAELQAWNEWTANQGRSADRPRTEAWVDPADDDSNEDDLYPPTPHRPDTEDEDEVFTPYKQLFSRLSESRPEG